MTIAAGDVDGVPAFWWQGPDGAGQDGKYTAGLMFRVGMADETLATRGITHLLEHLVLYPLMVDAAKHFNGHTEPLTTTFLTRGDADEVGEFFKAVCAGLRELPVSRIEKEKQVLRVESDGRKPSTAQLLLRHRYGAEGFGLASFTELGLGNIGAGDLAAWAARGFTRGNAALWLAGGEPPAGLRLDLPDGDRVPVPDMPDTIRAAPAYFNANASGPGFCGLMERSNAAQVYTSIVAGRLTAELRHKQALTYSPFAEYSVRDSRHAHVFAGAEGTAESIAVLTAEFLRLLSRLRDRPVDDGEFRAVTERMSKGWESTSAAAVLGRVQRAAQNALLGRPNKTPGEWQRDLAGLSPEDVRRVAREAVASGVFVLPRRQKSFIGDIPHVPWASAIPVTGRDVPSADAPFVATRLILGGEGVSIRHGEQALTVRFAECAALLAAPDGARELIGRDGLSVAIEPTLWRLPPDAISRIEEAVPGDRHVRTPYREPEKIPRPGTAAWMRLAGRMVRHPLAATAVTLVFVVGVPFLIGQFSKTAGFVVGCFLALTLGASMAAMRTFRILLWRAAAKRVDGVGAPPDMG